MNRVLFRPFLGSAFLALFSQPPVVAASRGLPPAIAPDKSATRVN